MSMPAPGSDSGKPLSRVTAALAVAEIPPSKLGPTRWARRSELGTLTPTRTSRGARRPRVMGAPFRSPA